MRSHALFIVVALLCLATEPHGISQERTAIAQDGSPSFSEWLNGVHAEALARGIRQEIVDQALGGVTEPLVDPVQSDLAQPEKVLSLEDFISRHLRPATVRTGPQ